MSKALIISMKKLFLIRNVQLSLWHDFITLLTKITLQKVQNWSLALNSLFLYFQANRKWAEKCGFRIKQTGKFNLKQKF